MKKQTNLKRKIHYFSFFEYFTILISGIIIAALPAIMYGVSFSESWNKYTIWYFIYWVIIAGILCTITAFQKYKRYEIPIQRLSKAAKQVANGDFSVYIEPIHSLDKLDYIDAMFDDFNKMVAELGSIETMKNDFIANVSHEIKTPLSIIKNYTIMLKKYDLPQETHEEYVSAIIQATDKIAALVSNILKLNKLENQQIDVHSQPYNLCRQLCDCALQYETLWEQKNICFKADIEDSITVTADKNMLELVWNNLLSNALKFTNSGGTITLHQTSTEHTITVTISDTGCGMDNDTMCHIFDKFYQGDTSHSGEGNGLGLALASRVIEHIGGTLSVTSQLGKGSTFTVNIFI